MKLQVNDGIFFRTYFDEMIVVDTILHKVHIINKVAAHIIDLISNGIVQNIDDIVETLFKIYIVDYNELETDCIAFVDYLVELRIINNSDAIMLESAATHAQLIELPASNQVEQEFIAKMSRKKQFISAILELTYRCNLSCIHCYAKGTDAFEQEPELSTNEIYQLLDDLYDCNVLKLTLTGGEVFVRQDFFDIYQYAIKKGFLVNIFSNATLLTDENIQSIAKLHPRSFQSSIYSSSPQSHDRITSAPGSYDKTLHVLKEFKKAGVAINIKTVLMNITQDDLGGIIALSEELGASLQAGISIEPKSNGDKTPTQLRITSNEKAEAILRMLDGYSLQTEEASINFNNMFQVDNPICGAGWSSLTIDPYGNVYPCNSLRILVGNVKKESIKTIWSNSEELNKVRNIKQGLLSDCKECDDNDTCIFCPGIALLENGDISKPYAEACFIAKVRKNLLQQERG